MTVTTLLLDIYEQHTYYLTDEQHSDLLIHSSWILVDESVSLGFSVKGCFIYVTYPQKITFLIYMPQSNLLKKTITGRREVHKRVIKNVEDWLSAAQ